jgi:DNA adenine methylase
LNFYSPLRYPGGKRRLSKFFGVLCEKNGITGHYIEPYAGGASVALYLLLNDFVKEITINDYDRSIYAFWYSILNYTERFCRKIADVEVNYDSWKKQKRIQDNKELQKNMLKLGFSTFFLNRTNYSGIINGGIIGGVKQNGKYKINCRFNKKELIKRIELISLHKKYINVKNMDALELIKKNQPDKNALFYFDPPYYLKGPSLYLNYYGDEDHKKVSIEVQRIKNAKWIVSYDNTAEIKKLYKNYPKREYELFHAAYNTRIGREILFFSNNLNLPKVVIPKIV